jgi:hypothetical protein
MPKENNNSKSKGKIEHMITAYPRAINLQYQYFSEVSMANEVWTDVLDFVERDKLARTVSLTNRHIHQICWPRLHGYKVMPHEVRKMIIASRDEFFFGWPWSTTAKLLIREVLMKEKEVPFANCPPPDYITRFVEIRIK